MIEHDNNFPATGTAGGPGGGGYPQPSCGNCEELTARVALLEEERRIIVRESDEARACLAEWRACARSLARVVDYLKPDLRDENDGWSQERMAMRVYDKLEAAK